ncbi:MAG: hypothetical protein OHK0052_12770 [Anaerolineales bacterium]
MIFKDENQNQKLEQAIATAREDILSRIITGAMLVAILGALVSAASQQLGILAGYGLGGFALYQLNLQKEWRYFWRAVALMAIIWLAGALSLLFYGLSGSGGFFLVALPAFAALLFGSRSGYIALGVGIGTWALAFGVNSLLNLRQNEITLLDWIFNGINLGLVMYALLNGQQQLSEAQEYVMVVSKQKRELQDTRAELTQRTKQLDYERYLLHTLLDTVSDRIFFKEKSGRYTRISKAVAKQYGVSPQAVLSKTDFDFFDPQYAAQIQSIEREIWESGQPILDRVEQEIWRDGRKPTWSITSRLPLRGDDGQIVGWIGTSRDITEIKTAQDAAQRRAQQLATAAEVSRAITSVLDLDELLRIVVRLLQQSFGFYGVLMWLLNENEDALILRAGIDAQGQILNDLNLKIHIEQSSLVASVYKQGQFRLENDVHTAQDYLLLETFPNTCAEMVLPLRVGNRVVGALDVQSNHANAFEPDDVLLMQSLADQVAIAIRNASLYAGERSRRVLVENLYDIGRALSSTLKLSEVLDLILAQLLDLVPYDRAAVMTRNQNELEFLATYGFPGHLNPQNTRVAIQENDVFEEIYRTKRPLSIPDINQRSDWQHIEGLPRAQTWLGIPLIRSDEVIGMLSLTRVRNEPYHADQITLATTFAGQAAIALENARLYEQITLFNQELEEKVAERTRELQKAYSDLERMDRTKSDFINVASHELRTPITVMRGYSQMLMQDGKIRENEYLQQLVSGIQSGTIRLHEIVDSMLDVAKLDSRALELYPEPLSIRVLLQIVTDGLLSAFKERKISLTLEDLSDLPPIEADPDALRKVFYHLIINAIKYTPDGGKVTIGGSAISAPASPLQQDSIEIFVRDTGIGISLEAQQFIFNKFTQTGKVALHSSGKTKFKGGGPGLGLAIARGIIEAHNGKISVFSAGHDEVNFPGSTFTIVLPLKHQRSTPKLGD